MPQGYFNATKPGQTKFNLKGNQNHPETGDSVIVKT